MESTQGQLQPTPTPESSAESAPKSPPQSIYDQLITDFCRYFFTSSSDAQSIIKILKHRLETGKGKHSFHVFERTWVLRQAYLQMMRLTTRSTITQSPDASSTVPLKPEQRLRQFGVYIGQLVPQQRFVVIALEKFGLPLDEVASAMQIPAASVKQIWKQALRSLEDWIWPKT